jgi:molecular chaperone DnaK
MSSTVIGIDLGTTNSCVAILDGRVPKVISSIEGGRTTPSVVGLNSAPPIVGSAARRQAILHPESTVTSIKRFIGRQLSEVEDEARAVAVSLTANDDGAARVEIGERLYSPEEISAMILGKLKSDAESFLGQGVDSAVVTVPAYFNDAQRQATMQAAEIAGLKVLRLVNEPTAAALAYGFGQEREERILVFDMGGGTLDVSVLEIGEGVFEVLTTRGDNHLGGDDFDQKIVDWLVQEFREDEGIDLTGQPEAMQRLYEAAERAKVELSSLPSAEIHLPFIGGEAGALHLNQQLTRSQLNELSQPLLARAQQALSEALADSIDRGGPVDQVILVGGMTRMPALVEMVSRETAKEPRHGVNPDEAVALGAAIQAGVLDGQVEDVLLLDVIPLSLGIETKGGIMTKLIEAKTTIPVRVTETFTTAEPNQPSVEVNVLQGERPMAVDNRFLGRIQLLGIPPAQPGVPQIEVVFDVDADGILNVSALDLGTGMHKEIKIESITALNDEEIEAARQEAEEFRNRDAADLEQAENLIRARAVIGMAGRDLEEKAKKMSADELSAIESGRDQIAELLASEKPDPEALKSATNALTAALQALANRLSEELEEPEEALAFEPAETVDLDEDSPELP